MSETEYNSICLEYQFLTKKSSINFQNYYGDYKCYDLKVYGVRDENLKFLKKFHDFSIKDFYTNDFIQLNQYIQEYLNAKLIIFEEKRICVHQEMAIILFHIIAFKLQNGIFGLLELLEKIYEQFPKYIEISNQKKNYVIKNNRYEELIAEFEKIQDYNFIFHFFNKAGSQIINFNHQNEIEFKVNEIKKILEGLKKFSFEKLPI